MEPIKKIVSNGCTFFIRSEQFGATVLTRPRDEAFFIDSEALQTILEESNVDDGVISSQQVVRPVKTSRLAKELQDTSDEVDLESLSLFVGSLKLCFPFTVNWSITSFCPFHCPHCYAESGPNETKFAIDLLMRTAKNFSGAFTVNVTGGEPLALEGIELIVRALKCYVPIVTLSTSGYLLDVNRAKSLRDAGLDSLQLSCDGDTIRGPSSYALCSNACETARVVGIPVQVVFTLTAANLCQIESIVQLCASEHVQELLVGRFVAQGRGKVNKYLVPETEHVVALHQQIPFLHSRYPNVKIVLDEAFPCSQSNQQKLALKERCAALTTICYVSPRGQVYPCHFLHAPEFCVGTLDESSLEQLWLSPQAEKIRFSLSKKNSHKAFSCESCSQYIEGVCSGACPAVLFWTEGFVWGTDPVCREGKVKWT